MINTNKETLTIVWCDNGNTDGQFTKGLLDTVIHAQNAGIKVHGANPYFTILEGLVDTDKYTSPVNFPFTLNNLDFEGLIPAGTPVAQVIPIKREGWSIGKESEKNLLKRKQVGYLRNSKFYDKYKKMFWEKKEYN